jgi:uncharacterized repeat protein (TIGR01451 family)
LRLHDLKSKKRAGTAKIAPGDLSLYRKRGSNVKPTGRTALSIVLLFSQFVFGSLQQTKTEDGPVSITFVHLFQDGPVSYDPVNLSSIQKLPSLPTGYTIFNNLAFRADSKAIWTDANVVFHLPSVTKQSDFDNLRILHLEFEELSSTKSAWIDRTVLPGDWDEKSSDLPKTRAEFNKLLPDFAARKITARVDRYLGLFVVARRDPAYQASREPFTRMTISVKSAPEPVYTRSNVTLTITVTNKGPKPAEEVWVQNIFNIDADFLSATATQGTCQRSNQSDDRTNCGLGALPVGKSVTIKILAKVRHNQLMDEKERKRRNLTFVIFKERSADMMNYTNMVQTEIMTTTIPGP